MLAIDIRKENQKEQNGHTIILAYQVYHWILKNTNLFGDPMTKKKSNFINITDFYDSMTESLLIDILELAEKKLTIQHNWTKSYLNILRHITQVIFNASKSGESDCYKKLLTICLKFFGKYELEIKPGFKELFLEILGFRCLFLIENEENLKIITLMIQTMIKNKNSQLELIITNDYVEIIKFIILTCYESNDCKKIKEILNDLLGLLIADFPFKLPLLKCQKKEEIQNSDNNSSIGPYIETNISLGQWFLNEIVKIKEKTKELKEGRQNINKFKFYYIILQRYFQIFKANNITEVKLEKPFEILNDALFFEILSIKQKESPLLYDLCGNFFEDKSDYWVVFYFISCISGDEKHLSDLENFYELMYTHSNPFFFPIFQWIIDVKVQLFPIVFKSLIDKIIKTKHKGSYYFFNNNLVRILLLLYNNRQHINSIRTEDFCRLLIIIKKQDIYKMMLVFPIKEDPKIKKTIIELIFDLVVVREYELGKEEVNSIFYYQSTKTVFIQMDVGWDGIFNSIQNYFNLDSLKSITNKLEIIPKWNISILFMTKTILVNRNEKNKFFIDQLQRNLFQNLRKSLKKENEESHSVSLFINIKKMILEKAGMKKDEEAYQAFVHDIQNLNYINKYNNVSSSDFELKKVEQKKPTKAYPILNLSNFNFLSPDNRGQITPAPPRPEEEPPEEKKSSEIFTTEDIVLPKVDDLRYHKYLKSVVFQKKEYLLTSFSLIFKNYYFDNLNFIKIKNLYHSIFEDNETTKVINFPSKIKNFTNGLEPPQFLKQNMKFFDEPYFSITHRYVVEQFKTIPKQPKINFYRSLCEDCTNMTIDCEIISIQHVFRGSLYFYDNLFCFVSTKLKTNDNILKYLFGSFEKEIVYDPNKKIFIYYRNINEIVSKRFLYKYQAFEIYLKNGKSYFVNFFSEENRNNFISKVSPYISKDKIILQCAKHFEINKYTQRWKDKEISTYDYLLLLNKYSSRSFNDGNQYFVFPWILKDFTNFLDTKKPDKSKWRDFATPPSVQCREMIEKAKEKFTMCELEGKKKKFKFHFNTHYSTSSFVYYYLTRMTPFLENYVKLQNNCLENPDRMFHSINEAINFMFKSSDNRELIPEFYSQIEFLINLNCAYLGRKSNKSLIDDLNIEELKGKIKSGKYSPTLGDYVMFLSRNRNFLKKREKQIHEWINYIFGENQFHQNKKMTTLFKKSTYEKGVLWDKIYKKYGDNKMEYIQKVREKKTLILNFGQSPMQIIDKSVSPMLSNMEGVPSNVGDDIISFGKCKKAKQHEREFESPALYFISNTEKEIFVFLLKSRKIVFSKIILKSGLFANNEEEISIEFNCPKYRLFKDKKQNRYKLSPKYALIFFEKLEAIITGRYVNNIFIIHYTKDKGKEISEEVVPCENFICSLARIDENQFLTGMKNGKLTQWIIEETLLNSGKNKKKQDSKRTLKAKQIKFVYAHEKAITVIEVNDRLKLIVTGGEDHFIYIRGLITFELLTVIQIRNYCIPKQITILKNNLLYCLSFLTKKLKNNENKKNSNMGNEKEEAPPSSLHNQCESSIQSSTKNDIDLKFIENMQKNENVNGNSIIIGFTLSGMKFAQSEPEDISCIDVRYQEVINASIYDRKYIIKYISHSLKVMTKKALEVISDKGVEESKYHKKDANEKDFSLTWIQNPIANDNRFFSYLTTRAYHPIMISTTTISKFFDIDSKKPQQ